MLKSYLLAGGVDNEDYRFGLRLLKLKLDEELLNIGYMDKPQADSHMTKEELAYKDVIASAIKPNRKQLDRGEWPPAKNLPDAKAPPSSFGANLATSDSDAPSEAFCGTASEVLYMIQNAEEQGDKKKAWTHGEVLALIKSTEHQASSITKSGTCHNCGVAGHWSRECPKPRQGASSGGRRGSGPTTWKKTAPVVGAPTTKVVNGKSFNWCGECVRWTTTHDTASHTGVRTTEASAHLAFSIDPSVWHTDLISSITLSDL
jgi:hypothetical protein